MMIPFGPQLIGETEKTLKALLLRFLADFRPHRAALGDAARGAAVRRGGLPGAGGRRHRSRSLPRCERARRCTDRPRPAPGWAATPAGSEVISRVLATSEREAGGIWRDHSAADVEATTQHVMKQATGT